jgi:hypothetical protein
MRTLAFGIALLATVTISRGENPFLSAQDNKPVSAKFRGAEWGDQIAQEEIPLSAKVVTTRLAKTNWGEIFKIAFTDIASRAVKRRTIQPEYFIATDDHIYLLNEENNEAAVKRLAAAEKAPDFEQSSVYGITEGKFDYTEGAWETTITLKDDLCVLESNHNSAGHFKKVVWKKGVGLVEYAMGYGAMADGFRLKRVKTN